MVWPYIQMRSMKLEYGNGWIDEVGSSIRIPSGRWVLSHFHTANWLAGALLGPFTTRGGALGIGSATGSSIADINTAPTPIRIPFSRVLRVTRWFSARAASARITTITG